MKSNGIKHIRTSPYHPASNGAAERLVQSFKQAMRASFNNGLVSQSRLATFLLTYRNTPHSTTGVSPSMLCLKRPLRTRLDLIHPRNEEHVHSRQAEQVASKASRRQTRCFSRCDRVLVWDFRDKSKWTPGVICEQTGPLSYTIDMGFGPQWRRHVDHIKEWSNTSAKQQDHASTNAGPDDYLTLESPSSITTPGHSAEQSVSGNTSDSGYSLTSARRYPSRNRKPVERFTSGVTYV